MRSALANLILTLEGPTEEQKSDLATANEDYYQAPKQPNNALQDLSVTYEKTAEEAALDAWNGADAKRQKVERATTKVCDAAPAYEAGIAAKMKFDRFCVATECKAHKGAAGDMLTKTLETMRMWRDTARVVIDASKECSRAAREVIRLKQQMVNKLEDETALMIEQADGERPTAKSHKNFWPIAP